MTNDERPAAQNVVPVRLATRVLLIDMAVVASAAAAGGLLAGFWLGRRAK